MAYVALGANLDNPAAQVQAAINALANLPQTKLLCSSSLYRTAPIGMTEATPDFINAVAALETTLTPQQLLAELLALEQRFGRRRDMPQAQQIPRTLDLDLLLFDAQRIDEVNEPALHIPHPRMHLRAFVLLPLAEIAPHCPIPERGNVTAWLPAVSMQGIQRIT